jgi:hypothetical protein
MKIPIEINLYDIIDSINKDDSLDLILKLDEQRGDCDFTLNLLKKLIESLESDMSRQEIADELGFLAT